MNDLWVKAKQNVDAARLLLEHGHYDVAGAKEQATELFAVMERFIAAVEVFREQSRQ